MTVKFSEKTTFQGKASKGEIPVAFAVSDGGAPKVTKDKAGCMLSLLY